MSQINSTKCNRKFLFLIVSSVFMLNACGKSIDVAEWTEEAKLHDGKIVTVWRKARAYSGGFPNSNRGRDIDFEFKYAPMHVEWKGVWNRNPVSFEIIDGTAYLTLMVGDKESCSNRPRTDYAAQFLRWSDGQWVDVKQADFPVDKAMLNLSEGYWGHSTTDDYKGLIRWDSKQLAGADRYKNPITVKAFFENYHQLCQIFFSN